VELLFILCAAAHTVASVAGAGLFVAGLSLVLSHLLSRSERPVSAGVVRATIVAVGGLLWLFPGAARGVSLVVIVSGCASHVFAADSASLRGAALRSALGAAMFVLALFFVESEHYEWPLLQPRLRDAQARAEPVLEALAEFERSSGRAPTKLDELVESGLVTREQLRLSNGRDFHFAPHFGAPPALCAPLDGFTNRTPDHFFFAPAPSPVDELYSARRFDDWIYLATCSCEEFIP